MLKIFTRILICLCILSFGLKESSFKNCCVLFLGPKIKIGDLGQPTLKEVTCMKDLMVFDSIISSGIYDTRCIYYFT